MFLSSSGTAEYWVCADLRPEAMSERYHQVTTRDGISLSAWIATPNRVPLATLLLCHGMTTDASEHGAFPAPRRPGASLGTRGGEVRFPGPWEEQRQKRGPPPRGPARGRRRRPRAGRREIGPDVPLIPLGLSFGGGPAIHAAATLGRGVSGSTLVRGYRLPRELQPGLHGAFHTPMPCARRARAGARLAEMPVLGTDYFFPKAMVTEMPDDRSMTGAGRSWPSRGARLPRKP